MSVRFDCLRPCSIEEACNILASYNGDAQLHAGGTDVLVQLRTGEQTPSFLVDLSKIEELKYIRVLDDSTLRVGALACLTDLIAHELVTEQFEALREAALLVGSVQIRNRATLVGNVCNASPAADTVPPLVIYNARVNVVGPLGTRCEPVAKFITGPKKTNLARGELVESIEIPLCAQVAASSYMRIARRKAVDLAIAGVAALVGVDGMVRFAYGAVSPRPQEGTQAAAILYGVSDPTSELLESAAETAAQEVSPINDVRSGAEYRRAMIGVLVKRTYTLAKQRLSQKINKGA